MLEIDINRHHVARSVYERALAAELAADGTVSAGELERLRQRTAEAFEEMKFCGRILVIAPPKTRRGLITLLKYLETNVNFMPPEVHGKTWPLVLVRGMRLSLRTMGVELDQVPE